MLIPILSERAYDYSSLSAGANLQVVLVKALDVTAYRSGSLLVRVHAASWGANTPLASVEAYMTAPSFDDPSQDFVGSSAKATATLADVVTTVSAGDLLEAALSSSFGSHLRIVLDVTQGSPAGNLSFTISAEMDLEEEP